MDDILKHTLDQNYATRIERLQQIAARFTDNSAFVAAESKQSFLHTQKLVAATAQNLLEKDGLADSILQSKNAGIYPNYMPAASS